MKNKNIIEKNSRSKPQSNNNGTYKGYGNGNISSEMDLDPRKYVINNLIDMQVEMKKQLIQRNEYHEFGLVKDNVFKGYNAELFAK